MYAYNPRKKTHEQLETSLVGADRLDILNGILKELSLKKGESPKQHWMIIGARGMGKSHLLTLLHHKVCSDKKLRNLWIPVLFPEEIRMAGDLAKFLERAISEIQHDLERSNSKLASNLKEKISTIRSIRHDERVDYLFSIITWIRRETDRYILLIAENLQQLLGKKISIIDQKKLRAFLQAEDALLLIGSATTIFDALHDHSHPFYHFFHIRRLNELSFEDVKSLVSNLLYDCGKDEQARIMLKNDARLRVIYSFTGGNPRMAVFLSDILKTDINEEMIDIMDRILDELTPYFEAIINDTPEYLQDIINALAAYEPAQSPKEIAEHLEMEQGTIRNYLKQAKDGGYVRIAFSKGKSNYYCLNEYLYRIWFQMRDSSHREEMRWLMELMLLIHSKEHIISENIRINECDALCHNNYHNLVKQTYDFMISNPSFCSIIDLCEKQSVNTKNKENTFDERVKRVKLEMISKFDELDKNKNISRISYIENASKIFIDSMFHIDSRPFYIFASYTMAIPMFFEHCLDINKTIKDYEKNILFFLEKNHDEITKILNILSSTSEFSEINFLLNIATENYNASLKMAKNITYKKSNKKNVDEIDFSVILLTIQIIYYANKENYKKMFSSYEALHNINKNLQIENREYYLHFIAIMSYIQGVVSEETANILLEYAKSKSKRFYVVDNVWTCIKNPDSEIAQKLMTEPAIADTVNKINSLAKNHASTIVSTSPLDLHRDVR